ncbi:hypothetical protein [Acidianus manzaensis]|uniref:Uncharacterized protein n=1 Tax=Acidianus manzaensis TaxID=282676 RepID=A0A1W6JYM4_9CREN|nr:hypothetical protein [Acidianus manzaensis]ARM75342.1 hypothetical protein B6F84_04370 [Acidianus manzaensis]
MLSPLVLAYVIYVIIMTPLLAWSIEQGLNKNNQLAFLIMIITFVNTMIFLILFSLNNYIILISTCILLLVIPITIRNLGFYKPSLITLLIFNEIIMSLLYYVILRGFSNSITALDFYGTDIPTTLISSPIQVFYALIELSNSFMFFLMIIPEIIYFSFKTKNSYPILLAILGLAGPNIASEMTHSILSLPYDPISQASILVSILSFSLTIYLFYKLLRNQITIGHFLTFIIFDILLSCSSLYYSITINEIPYGIATLLAIAFSFLNIDIKNKIDIRGKTYYILSLFPLSLIPQVLWGISISEFYYETFLSYPIGLGIGISFLSILYVISRLTKIMS